MMSTRPAYPSSSATHTHTRPHLDRPLSSPTLGNFSASTFASLGYSDSFVRGMFRDQSSASSSPPSSPRRPQRPRRPSSGLVTVSTPTRPSMEIKSPSYSIPPLSGRLAGLEIDDARAGERERERRPIRKEDVRREDIRVVRTEDDSSALRLAPAPTKQARQRSFRRSLPLQPAPPPPTTGLPPVPTYQSGRSISPTAETLRERRMRSRSPAVAEVDEERRSEREAALRALEGRR